MTSQRVLVAMSGGVDSAVALVRAGATFKKGQLVQRPDEESGGNQLVA